MGFWGFGLLPDLGIFNWVVYALFFLSLLAVYMYYNQNNMLYMPEAPHPAYKYPENNPPKLRNPGEEGIPYESIIVTTSDNVKLHGWMMLHPSSISKPTILFFHANAGNIGMRIPLLKILFNDVDANIIIVGYRGYGHS